MDHLTLDRDSFVFTDRTFTVAGIVAADEDGPATMLTSVGARALRDAFFPPRGADAFDIATVGAALEAEIGARDAGDRLGRLGGELPGLAVSDSAPPLGDVAREDFETDGTIRVGGREVFRPAGALFTRTVGEATLSMSVSVRSLSGAVRPTRDLEAVTFRATGPTIVFGSSKCGACGACGACGGCALCGGVNFSASAAAAVAAAALAALAAVDFATPVLPTDRPEPHPGPDLPGDVYAIDRALVALGAVAPLPDQER